MAPPKPKTGYPNSSGLYRITAPIATRLLASEPIRQRVPTSGRIDMYARDIVNDRWEINGSPRTYNPSSVIMMTNSETVAFCRRK